MKTADKCSQRGHAALETAMFLPLLVFFIFVVVDAGLAFSERSAFTNRLRSSLQSETLKTKAQSLLEVDPNFNLILSAQAGQQLQEFATDIFNSLIDIQGMIPGQSADSVSMTLSLVIANIDTVSGVLQSYSIPLSVNLPSGIQNPDLPQFNPHFNYITRETYLDAELAVGLGVAPSRYAIRIGPSYDATNQAVLPYAPATALLFAEVTAVTRGVNPGYVKQVLGNFYAIQNQQLLVVRTQIR